MDEIDTEIARVTARRGVVAGGTGLTGGVGMLWGSVWLLAAVTYMLGCPQLREVVFNQLPSSGRGNAILVPTSYDYRPEQAQEAK